MELNFTNSRIILTLNFILKNYFLSILIKNFQKLLDFLPFVLVIVIIVNNSLLIQLLKIFITFHFISK
jgi:hypothetical protein